MNVKQCENGHYVDTDKYDLCPVCGGNVAALGAAEPNKEEEHERKGRFGRKGKHHVESIDEKTIGKFVDSPSKARLVNEDVEDENDTKPPVIEKPDNSSEKETEDISKSIEDVKTNDDRTIGYFSSGKQEANESDNNSKSDTEPPVGWLVCVKGKNFGKTFPIFAGQNTIGRNSNYTIALTGDNYVSASNIHAKLIYEPNSRQFMLMNGDSGSLTYLNGNAVYVPTQMKAFDKISFGKTGGNEYVFLPLCGDNFSWTDYAED